MVFQALSIGTEYYSEGCTANDLVPDVGKAGTLSTFLNGRTNDANSAGAKNLRENYGDQRAIAPRSHPARTLVAPRPTHSRTHPHTQVMGRLKIDNLRGK